MNIFSIDVERYLDCLRQSGVSSAALSSNSLTPAGVDGNRTLGMITDLSFQHRIFRSRLWENYRLCDRLW